MAVVRCDKGLHFYDNERYDHCPHCGTEANSSWTDMGSEDFNSQVTMSMPEIDPNVIDTVGVIHEQSINYEKPKIYVDDIDDDVTMAYYSASKGNDFITGWLVCVEGPDRGRDYRIYHGVNKLGRGDDMDIIIRNDKTISREKVCSLVYDGKDNRFYVLPHTNGMIYLNGENIREVKEIVTGDSLFIGQSTFEFIAFCKGDRKWQ